MKNELKEMIRVKKTRHVEYKQTDERDKIDPIRYHVCRRYNKVFSR